MATDRGSNALQNSLEFLYRTAATRGPGKRPLRIVKADQFDDADGFDVSDDDDEDYEQPEDDDDKASGSVTSTESANDNALDGECSDRGGNSPSRKRHRSISVSSPTNEQEMPMIISGARPLDSSQMVAGMGKDSALICCVCLNLRSLSEDVIQCDCCGLTVHETCYGITDADSELSDGSVESTEPWFCEPCLAGFQPDDVFCELCPNRNGAFKRTNTGSWVHLVCALYNPHVTFSETDNFGVPILGDVDYSMYGSRACALCANKIMARTGMCINCDAGLCRTFFHVTCSQKRGLLVDSSSLSPSAPQESAAAADPFYACCSFHSDPDAMALKRRRYEAMQRQLVRMSRKVLTMRESKSLERKRKKFLLRFKSYLSRCTLQTSSKHQRLLTTSAEVLTKMLLKNQVFDFMVGEDDWGSEFRNDIATNIVGRFYMPISFSADFVTYYTQREKYILTLSASVDAAVEENVMLRQAQDYWNNKQQTLQTTSKDLEQSVAEDYKNLVSFATLCSQLGVKNVPSLAKSFPELERKRLSEQSCNSSAIPLAPLSTSSDTALPVFTCEICSKSHDQHLLVFCDTCRHYYHLDCLDPPLKRMPKKTSLYGWECSTCAQRDSDSSVAEDATSMNIDMPRQLRTEHKPVQRFIAEIASSDREHTGRNAPAGDSLRHHKRRFGASARRGSSATGARTAAVAVKPSFVTAVVRGMSSRPRGAVSSRVTTAKTKASPDIADAAKVTTDDQELTTEPIKSPMTVPASVKRSSQCKQQSPKEMYMSSPPHLEPITPPHAKTTKFAKALSIFAPATQHVAKAVIRCEAAAAATAAPTLAPALAPSVSLAPSVLSTNNFIVDSYDRSDIGMEIEVHNSFLPKTVASAAPNADVPKRRLSYSCEAMTKAVEAVLSGKMGARRASLLYGVPRSTIGRHVRNVRGYFATSRNENVEIIRVEDLD